MRKFNARYHTEYLSLFLLLCISFPGYTQSGPVITDITGQVIDEGGAFTEINLDESVADPDNPDADLSWTISNNVALQVNIANRIAQIEVPNSDWFGNETLVFTVIDPDSNLSFDEATFTVNPVNDPPVITGIPGQEIAEGGNFSGFNLNSYVNDADNDLADLSWSASISTNLLASIDGSANATVTVNDANWNGSEAITYTVTDPAGDFDTDDALYIVTGVNDLPVAAAESITVDEGADFSTPAPGVLSNDTDVDGDLLSAVLVSGPAYSSSFALDAEGSFSYSHNGSSSTGDSFTYVAYDGSGQSNEAVVSIIINPLNDSPVITDIADESVTAGTGFSTIDLDHYVSDEEDPDDLLSWTHEGNTELQVAIGDNHVATITPPQKKWAGSETITFIVTDTENATDSETATFTATALAEAPVAVADEYTLNEAGTLNEAAPGVLSNDTDADPLDVLTTDLVSGPSHETSFTLNADGSFSYTHDGTESGDDSFTYRAYDQTQYSNTVTVTLHITPVNDAPVAVNDAYTVAEGGTLTHTAATGVLDNDTDAENNTLTAEKMTDPVNGTLTLNSDGSFTYIHNGSETTTDQFTYRASDGTGNSNIATVSLTITPQNDLPVAVNDAYTVAESGTLNPNAGTGVLSNDTDAENNTLTAVKVTDPANGTLNLNSNGSFTYVHNGSETTTDQFTYRANDGTGNSNIATVTITITGANDPPVAVNDAYSVAEGGTLNPNAESGVLSNDTDPENNTLTAIKVTDPVNGTLDLNSNGSFTYVHNGSETTTDQFTYRANDGTGNSNIATVTITVTGANDPPVAVNDAYTVAEGGTLTRNAGNGVLANDTDAENNPLTAVKVTDPANGTLTLNANGSFTYVHNGSETTTDQFTYRANDGTGNSNTATVSFTITPQNDLPVAVNDAYNVAEGGTLNPNAASGVLSNDTDPENNTLTAVKVTDPANGTLTLNANGSFTYVHNGTETTTDQFTYRANDGTGNSNIATVAITITGANDPPVAVNDAYNVAEGGTLNPNAASGVLSNDTDPENNPLTAVKVTDPANGTLTLNLNGSFTYVHNGSETTTDQFTYRANDGTGNSNIATVSITITPQNDPPVAVNDAYTVAEGGTLNQSATGGVLTNDTDPENNPLTAVKVTDPANGTLTLNTNGSFIYVHNGSETTTDQFTYRANDGTGNSNTATVTLTITSQNDPPVATNVTITALNNKIGTAQTGSFTFTDPDGDNPGIHTYHWYRSDFANGSSPVTLTGATSSVYTPVKADGGKYIGFEVTPVDEHGLAGTPVRTVTFTYINAAPVASNAQVQAPQSTPGTEISGTFTYFDKESNPSGAAIYRWYRRNDNVPNYSSPGVEIGTQSTYRLVQADATKYIWFKVTPVATTGSSPGDSIWSNIIGPIGSYTANITGSDTFCYGTVMPVTLTITGGKAPYKAILHRAGNLPKDTTITDILSSPRTINVRIPGTYTLVEVTDEGDDKAEISTSLPVNLVINPRSKALISGSTSLCQGVDSHAQLSLNFIAGVQPWSVTIRRREVAPFNDTTISGIILDPYGFKARIIGAGPTRHRVIAITDVNGCPGDTASGSAWLSYKTSPIAVISGSDSICPGETANLTVTLSSGTSPWSFSYQRNGVHVGTFANIQNTVQTVPVTQTGTYTLSVVTDPSGTGCGSGEAVLTGFSLPTATISGTTTICEHTPANLTVTLTGKSPWKFAYHRNLINDSTVVENVSASPRVVQVRKPGTYRLYQVIDRNGCKGTYSGSAVITVTPAPVVTISGLKTAYNFEQNEIDTIIGSPLGGEYGGPGVIGNFFIPRIAGLGTHNITYRYRTSPASCYGYDTAVVNVLESNALIKFENDRSKYCENDGPFTVRGINLADDVGHFTISGGIGLLDHDDNTATIYPDQLNPNTFTITYSYFIEGEPFFETAKFDIGPSPVAVFNWATECYHAGQPIDFVNLSTPGFGFLTDSSYIWKISTNTGFDSDSSKNMNYSFPEAGIYRIELKLLNSNGCSDTAVSYFNLRPTLVLGDRYFESFETNPISWQSEKADYPVNSWKLGNPSKHDNPPRGFSGAYSDTSCWYTQITGAPAPAENSWISSPCFDFSQSDKPMLTLQIWRLFNSNRDGANIQASADSGKNWYLVGEIGDGQNWFNTSYIRGEPGGKDNGWSNYDGVSNDGNWIRARHGLDYLKGKKDVQFRIAYGSDGTPQNNDGIAFDDFTISERTKMSLIEHFTNTGLNSSRGADSTLDAFAEAYGMNAVNIQYHTSDPSGDPFYEDNPIIPTSRQFYYGLSAVPYAVIDGGAVSRHQIDYDVDSKPFDRNTVIRQSLNDSKFQVRVVAERNGNLLTSNVFIIANEELPLMELSVRSAVVESVVEGISGTNGDTLFRNVVRAMLPDAAGNTLYKSWDLIEDLILENTWDIENVVDVNRLLVVAFIQNEATREIYNVDVDTVVLSTGAQDPLPKPGESNSFSVYPNPARRMALIQLDGVASDDISVQLFNNTGRLVYASEIPEGAANAEIPVEELPEGLYVIRLLTEFKLLGIKKLIVIR